MGQLVSLTDRLAEKAAAEWITARQKTIRSLRTEASQLAYVRKAFLAGSDWAFARGGIARSTLGKDLTAAPSKYWARVVYWGYEKKPNRELMMFHGWAVGYQYAQGILTGKAPWKTRGHTSRKRNLAPPKKGRR